MSAAFSLQITEKPVDANLRGSMENIAKIEESLAAQAARGNHIVFVNALESLKRALTLHNSLVSMKIVSPLKQINKQTYQAARNLFLSHNRIQKEIRLICVNLIADAPLLSEADTTQTDGICFLDEKQKTRIFSALHEIKMKFHELRNVWIDFEVFQ